MCQRFDVTGNLKNLAKFSGTKLVVGCVLVRREARDIGVARELAMHVFSFKI
jgi:hypothetical protein